MSRPEEVAGQWKDNISILQWPLRAGQIQRPNVWCGCSAFKDQAPGNSLLSCQPQGKRVFTPAPKISLYFSSSSYWTISKILRLLQEVHVSSFLPKFSPLRFSWVSSQLSIALKPVHPSKKAQHFCLPKALWVTENMTPVVEAKFKAEVTQSIRGKLSGSGNNSMSRCQTSLSRHCPKAPACRTGHISASWSEDSMVQFRGNIYGYTALLSEVLLAKKLIKSVIFLLYHTLL